MRVGPSLGLCIATALLGGGGCHEGGTLASTASTPSASIDVGTGSCPDDPGFLGTYPSADALATAFLTTLRDDDAARLAALALDEREFRCQVWPHLPSSRPERGLTVDYVWGDLNQKSQNALAFTRRDHAGRRLDLRRLTFAGGTTDYGPFRVHRETRLTVIDEFGRLYNVQLFGSMLEAGGQYKIFSFVTD